MGQRQGLTYEGKGGNLMNHLYRSRQNSMIGGVAGGIAEYFSVDVAVVRLLWLLSILLAGGGLLAYIIAWIVIPEEPLDSERTVRASENPQPQPERAAPVELSPEQESVRDRRRSTGGLLLIGLGVLFLAHELAPLNFSRFIWPVLLIVVGVFIFVKGWEGNK
jgi:phage shock protein C